MVTPAKADPHKIAGLKDKLEALRKECGWSGRTVADKAQLPSPTHYSLILKHESAKVPQLIKLAQAFDVDLEYLVGIQDVRRRGRDHGPLDIYAEVFFHRLSHRQTLIPFVLKHTKHWRMSDVITALDLPHESDNAGTPVEGWASLLNRGKSANEPSAAGAGSNPGEPPHSQPRGIARLHAEPQTDPADGESPRHAGKRRRSG